jgi:hypothetical protein
MKPHTISTLEGIFILSEDGHYVPYEPAEPRPSHPVLMLVFLIAIGWAALIGAGYAICKAVGAIY